MINLENIIIKNKDLQNVGDSILSVLIFCFLLCQAKTKNNCYQCWDPQPGNIILYLCLVAKPQKCYHRLKESTKEDTKKADINVHKKIKIEDNEREIRRIIQTEQR